MNTVRLQQFRRIFANYNWTSRERRHYAKQWAASVRHLGSNWRALPCASHTG